MTDSYPDQPDPDPATRASTRFEGEMAMMRRAVEHLATEKAEIDIPDYSRTLGEMANRLVAIERQPAMQMTPGDFEARMTAAAARARRDDQAALALAKREHGEAVRDLRAIIGTANTIYEHTSKSGSVGGMSAVACSPDASCGRFFPALSRASCRQAGICRNALPPAPFASGPCGKRGAA